MIAVKADHDHLQVTIPTKGLTVEEVNDLISWLRVETIARRSKLTQEAAWELSESVKSSWWEANERRFTGQEGK